MDIIPANDSVFRCLEIRRAVFVSEQGVPPELEADEYDKPGAPCDHYLLMCDKNPVGAFRVLLDEGAAAHIGRLCILKEYRGRGYGRAALEFAANTYGKRGYAELLLGAQCHAIPFYEKCGFTVISDVYDDAGIPHRKMKKQLYKGDNI